MNKKSSIQRKIMRVIMLTSGIVLIMTCAAFFVYEYITAREMMRRQIYTFAQMLSTNSVGAVSSGNHAEASTILNSLSIESSIHAAALYDQEGKLFAKYPADLSTFFLPVHPGRLGYYFDDHFLEGFHPVLGGNARIGTIYLRSDMRPVYRRFGLYGIIASVFIIISFFFAWLISKKLQKTVSMPILQLAETARIVSDERNYSVRATKRSDDEVGMLTDAFNHMLTTISLQNKEIVVLNQNLENKVKDRTRDLEKANEALTQQTEFSKNILDSSVDLIAVFDTSLRFITLNKHAEETYKFTSEQLFGRYVADVFPQTIESGMVRDLTRASQGEMVRQVNYYSGVTKRHYESFYIPLKNKEGQVYCILTIAHDITEIINANEKLQLLNAELEKSNNDLEQFAYVASHDLQEPLRKIQTFTELGERNIEHPETLRKYLAKVNSSAQRMTELIKAVLNYSRLSKSEYEFVEVDLNKILQDIYADLELLIEEKQAVIENDNLPVIFGIPLQVHQLFFNLITNSLKFNDNIPVINIRSRFVFGRDVQQESIVADREYLEIIFSDNGIGFDQKFAEKVFSIFQRLHSDKKVEGTGIGLAICKKIVENHQGFISVNSELKKGTTFYIYFPLLHVRSDQFTNTSSTNTQAV